MEVNVRTKCVFPDVNSFSWAKKMLSDDPPLFDDEVPEKYHAVFNAFENTIPPESFKANSKNALILDWTFGSDWQSEIAPFLTNLIQMEGVKLFTCAVADEEGVFIIADKTECLLSAAKLAAKANTKISYGFGWINKVFVYLEKNHSDSGASD